MSGHSAGPNDSGYRRAGIEGIAERGDHHVVLGKVIDSRLARAPAGRPDAAILEMKDLGEKVFYGG